MTNPINLDDTHINLINGILNFGIGYNFKNSSVKNNYFPYIPTDIDDIVTISSLLLHLNFKEINLIDVGAGTGAFLFITKTLLQNKIKINTIGIEKDIMNVGSFSYGFVEDMIPGDIFNVSLEKNHIPTIFYLYNPIIDIDGNKKIIEKISKHSDYVIFNSLDVDDSAYNFKDLEKITVIDNIILYKNNYYDKV